LLWELPSEEPELPPGDDPLVLVAPSTSQDPSNTLVRAALKGLADEPVRVLAVKARNDELGPIEVPPNAKVVTWLGYSRAMPHCAAVICHAGHGTIGLALQSGTPVVACPFAGDMAETSARIRWAGLGVSLPRRFHTPRGIKLALRRLLSDPTYARNTHEIAEWTRRNHGPSIAAEELEAFATGDRNERGARRAPL
jgi:UDP:flavonoid glycosyltransferase YjiC (YdhE family)